MSCFRFKKCCLLVAVTVLLLGGPLGLGHGLCESDAPTPPPPPNATGTQSDESVKALILLLKAKGLLSNDEVDALHQRLSEKTDSGEQGAGDTGAHQPLPAVSPRTPVNKSVEAVQEKLDRAIDQLLQRDRLTERRLDQLDSKVNDDIAARQYKSSWAQRIKISGDLRLRYQSEMYHKENDWIYDFGNYPDIINTTEDRERYRYRARLGLKAKIVDPRDINVGKASVGLRLATGNTDDPVSTNQTMGDAFNKDNFLLDRAYVEYTWSPIEETWGGIPRINLVGGRMPNPFFCSDLVWDGDLNFEGIVLKLESDTLSGSSWRSFLTAGAFPLEELRYKSSDKWLYGGQIGMVHRPFWGLNYTLAVAYYEFTNNTGEAIGDSLEMDEDGWNWSVPKYRQKGNSSFAINDLTDVDLPDYEWGLASKFTEINVTAAIDIDRFYPVHIILLGDYVYNIAYDKDEIEKRVANHYNSITSLEEQNQGYQYGVTVGYPKVRNPGEWNFSIHYKRLEADAVLDAFTDSDFHGGGTDAEGYAAGLQVGLFKNIWLTGRYLTADEAYKSEDNDGDESDDAARLSIDLFQVDVSVEF